MSDTKRICKICGKEFEPHVWSSGQKSVYQTICDNCASYNKISREKVCLTCGKKFIETRKSIKDHWPNNKYCSIECANQALITTECKVCGKSFLSKVDRQNKTKQVYCSIDCANTIDIENRCLSCGEIFITHPTLDGRKRSQKFCNKCRKIEKVTKIKETCQLKYGVDYPCLTEKCINHNYQAQSEINNKFCNRLKSAYMNDFETEFRLEDKYYDIKLDNILIEINPTITHTSVKYIDIFTPKDINYHLNKTKIANRHNYKCIHVWQWDNWDNIIYLIKPKNKLYARKLKIKQVDKTIINSFLNRFHLQGSCYGNEINLGLYDENNNLIQVMAFGKPRYNKNYEYELLRLCTHSDYYVVGGAERLFKHFIKGYKPESIISYCDVSKFNGDVYERLNFKFVKQTLPQKIWSKNEKYITDNLLRQRGFDQLVGSKLNPPQLYGKGTDNEQLMLEHGWLPVYDCGQKVFEYKQSTVIS